MQQDQGGQSLAPVMEHERENVHRNRQPCHNAAAAQATTSIHVRSPADPDTRPIGEITARAAPSVRQAKNSAGIAKCDFKGVQGIAQFQKTQVQSGAFLQSRRANRLGGVKATTPRTDCNTCFYRP